MFEKRVNSISNFLNENTAALISSSTNRLYFTGFESSAGVVLILKTVVFF